MNKNRRAILLVDDHDSTRETISEVLVDLGHQVHDADTVRSAVECLDDNAFDLVLTDLKLPDGTGLDVMRHSKTRAPAVPVVMITGHATIENAVEATRLGAYEYLTKPVDLNRLRVVVANALRLVELERRADSGDVMDALVGQGAKMRGVKDYIKQIAHTDATVLIEGESGTGKELVANAIQALSVRRDGPFVRVNVAALGKGVVESELFGHEKGAFTGAIRLRKGRFELADGGTLFLDEISEMPPEVQVKLLRVLQERELERVGGGDTIPLDIRLICATHRNLKQSVLDGTFREDLYYRINVVRILVPPLRERMDDLPLLAEHFRSRFAARYGVQKRFAPETLASLSAHAWPGNVRELENAIESAVVRSPGEVIGPGSLPEDVLSGPGTGAGVSAPSAEKRADGVGAVGGVVAGLTMAEVEKRYILDALERAGGNKTAAARVLDIGTKTLYRKLEEYGFQKEET